MEAIISKWIGCVNTLLSLLLIYFHRLDCSIDKGYVMIHTDLSTGLGDNFMEYTGALDDLSAINAYLAKVQELINRIKLKHGV